MISGLENMDVMIGSSLYEREGSEFGNSVRRPESRSNDTLVDHNSNNHSNSRENEIRAFAGNGQISEEISANNEMNRLTGKLNQRIAQEINGLMSSVSMQMQRVINQAIKEQVVPQMQAL